ncbi:MAG: hypothetical protein P4M12_10055 [Gammaproteobacteria bacterium]|nr:hypothetical protein [Gammaproteobacteria bacterium]
MSSSHTLFKTSQTYSFYIFIDTSSPPSTGMNLRPLNTKNILTDCSQLLKPYSFTRHANTRIEIGGGGIHIQIKGAHKELISALAKILKTEKLQEIFGFPGRSAQTELDLQQATDMLNSIEITVSKFIQPRP